MQRTFVRFPTTVAHLVSFRTAITVYVYLKRCGIGSGSYERKIPRRERGQVQFFARRSRWTTGHLFHSRVLALKRYLLKIASHELASKATSRFANRTRRSFGVPEEKFPDGSVCYTSAFSFCPMFLIASLPSNFVSDGD